MLSSSACSLIARLNAAGFEAFAVGGCVRDMLLGKKADDIDITTSAHPEQTAALFSDCRVIPTGLSHGTVTVLTDGQAYEITTYRTDGRYSDGRHPDNVRFTSSLKEDLARRDFTVNAIAYHPKDGIVDPFGGQKDLDAHCLRCVGDPSKRFAEDALRIARLVRFAAVLGFAVEPDTAAAAHTLCARLDLVAAERKRVELFKLLTGASFLQASLSFSDILCRIVPCLTPLVGFDQRNPHHDFDIYTHTVRAVDAAPRDLIVRLALLFHDVGKPSCFTVDEQQIGHFYGHAAQSEALAEDALRLLRTDTKTVRAVLPLVRYHDIPLFPSKAFVRRWLSRLGEDAFFRLLEVKKADASACKENRVPPDFSDILCFAEEIRHDKDCLSRSSLAINGSDLLSLGVPPGPAIGDVLQALLDEVMAGRCDNEKSALEAAVKERWI